MTLSLSGTPTIIFTYPIVHNLICWQDFGCSATTHKCTHTDTIIHIYTTVKCAHIHTQSGKVETSYIACMSFTVVNLLLFFQGWLAISLWYRFMVMTVCNCQIKICQYYLHIILYVWWSLTKPPNLNPPIFVPYGGDLGPNCQIWYFLLCSFFL